MNPKTFTLKYKNVVHESEELSVEMSLGDVFTFQTL